MLKTKWIARKRHSKTCISVFFYFKPTADGTTFDIHNMKTYCGANDYKAYNGVGMFGKISGATIKNVNNYDVNIKSRLNTGALVGSGHSSTIQNCKVTGLVTGTAGYIGGLVGDAQYTTILECVNEATVKGDYCVGGIVGRAFYSAITNCVNYGSIEGSYRVGGIVGNATVAITITYCGAKVNVTVAGSTVQPFYSADSGGTVTCNDSYSLVNNKGTQINRITATNSGMDGKFGMIPTIHDGLPVPLGIYHTSQYGTTTGIASTLKGSQYGCTTA